MCKQAFSRVVESKRNNGPLDSDESDEEETSVNNISSLKTMHEAVPAAQMTKKMAIDSGSKLSTFRVFNLRFNRLPYVLTV